MPAPMKQPHWRTRLQRVALLVNPANFFHATAASQIAFEAIAQFPETDVDKADLESLIGDLMSGQYSDSVRVVASTPPNIGQLMCRKMSRMTSGAALILRAMIWRHRLGSSSRRTPVLRVSCRCD